MHVHESVFILFAGHLYFFPAAVNDAMSGMACTYGLCAAVTCTSRTVNIFFRGLGCTTPNAACNLNVYVFYI